MKQGIYITNSYQTPNFYADSLDIYLTPIETKVLWKILREIIGYHEHLYDRQNVVSLQTIVDGKISKEDGRQLSYGCGLNRQTVQKALNNLCRFGIITKIRQTAQGLLYQVNFDTDKIDWEGLQQRYQDKKIQSQQRTAISRGSEKWKK